MSLLSPAEMPPTFRVAFPFYILMLTTVCAAGCADRSQPASSPAVVLSEARSALRQADYSQARQLASAVPKDAPEWQAAMLVAGEAAARAEEFESAFQFYIQAADHDQTTADGQLARFSAADLYLDRCQLTAAEQHYRAVLRSQPANALTHQRMAFLLSITGRRWEALDHYFVLIQGGDADYRELGLAADLGRPIEQPEFLSKCSRLAPSDPLVQLARAVHAFDEGKPEAKHLLQELITTHPDMLAAQTRLGELLVDAGDDAAFVAWHDQLPAAADESADVWFVRGLWARKQSNLQIAADCFWQSLARTPFHRRAFYSLGQTLVALRDPQAERVVSYSEGLIQLSQSIDQVLISEGRNPAAFQQTAETLLRLGRVWEGCAWAVEAERRMPGLLWPTTIFQEYRGQLSPDLPWVLNDQNPAATHTPDQVTEFAALVDDVRQRTHSLNADGRRTDPGGSRIHFIQTTTIPFQYDNADDPGTEGARTFEQTGGGVAILDFDRDGSPDVFFSQGQKWPTGSDAPAVNGGLTDQLFRNHHGRQFLLTETALPAGEREYGQGCAAGDFNNDGFPDLYVANVGRNALYVNQGDGTFLEHSSQAELTDSAWTSSVTICDFNADGQPDLFDVNYLTGDGIYHRICDGLACSPSAYAGAPDCVRWNQGDGTFQAAQFPGLSEHSKGLGLVCLSLHAQQPPAVFIASDQVANQLLSFRPAADQAWPTAVDEALVAGVAFDANGLPLGCMGVAADDWDGNGLLDLFVTNFHNESNTVYLQDTPGLFVDATNAMGVKTASLMMTGWGTQSLDADLDGFPDLVVANGHVDDYRQRGGEYHMRPQFFRNEHGRFRELSANTTGEWFEEKFLGRGLARVDWNLDGRSEWIVSNINAPVSVLTNVSTGAGHVLQVELVGTLSARDAIGTVLTLQLPDRQLVRQMTAGDGYMASNQRMVEFGLGDTPQIGALTIEWPSGAITTLDAVESDCLVTIIEDRPGVVLQRRLPGPGPKPAD